MSGNPGSNCRYQCPPPTPSASPPAAVVLWCWRQSWSLWIRSWHRCLPFPGVTEWSGHGGNRHDQLLKAFHNDWGKGHRAVVVHAGWAGFFGHRYDGGALSHFGLSAGSVRPNGTWINLRLPRKMFKSSKSESCVEKSVIYSPQSVVFKNRNTSYLQLTGQQLVTCQPSPTVPHWLLRSGRSPS